MPPPKNRFRKRFIHTYKQKNPELTVSSIASWWAGCAKDDDNIELGDLSILVSLREGQRLTFITTKPERRLELSESAHGHSLPFAVGRAVIGALNINDAAKLACAELDHLADLMLATDEILDGTYVQQ